ncbi:MAG: alkaline phosphatase [Deltaproteobacteria bacterium]|nr:alkaline phosphatase [Deltaproteobacteria bacterium]
MNRRDFLKTSLASFFTLVASSQEIFAKATSSNYGGSKGVVFIVGDGWPLGVMRTMNEFIERKFKEKSYLFSLLNNPRSRIALQNTSSLSSIVTDSAPASVAWATGSKTINRSLAVLPNGTILRTIFELGTQAGLSCGFVTTTRITHATPAAWYSHNPNRDDEESIAIDLLNSNLKVAMGGGDRFFNPERRKDRLDLYAKFVSRGYKVVKTREELKECMADESPILGIFSSSHMSYFVDRINDEKIGKIEPSLPEMAMVALQKLSKNRKGFILQIEAGRIDHACHANDAYAAMMDSYELDKTVGVVLEFINKNPDVLLIVTSDHGNSGYGINGTGPEYNDSTEALMSYKNKASFEYMIRKMRNQDVRTLKEIFETYTGQGISIEEAEEIYKKLNEKKKVVMNDIWYEPEATMGMFLRKSVYEYDHQEDRPINPPKERRGNVGFTSTNHTGEDQLVIVYGKESYLRNLKSAIDNTHLYDLMCSYMNIKHLNPKMSKKDGVLYAKPLSPKEWERHLRLHIS